MRRQTLYVLTLNLTPKNLDYLELRHVYKSWSNGITHIVEISAVNNSISVDFCA